VIIGAVWPFHRAGHARMKIRRNAPGNWSGIFSLAVNATTATLPFAEVTMGLPVHSNTTIISLVGPKYVRLAINKWNLWRILAKQCSGWRVVFDENQVFKSKSRSIPAARSGRNDAG
jgi:hypothetical protein